MFIDHCTDYADTKVLFKGFVNTVNYVVIDQAYLTHMSLFIRKFQIEGQPWQDGTQDFGDVHTAASILTSTKDYFPYDGNQLVMINLRVDSFKNYIQINRVDWMNQIGIVGGIAGFYTSCLAIVVGYFTEIDYHATVIKKLFLES